MQYVLDLNDPPFNEAVTHQFLHHVCVLSAQKFSSNVIEKCIRVADPASRKLLIDELIDEARLESLLRDSFANYVVQTALDYAEPAQRAQLVNCIRPILPAIRNTPYGKRIQSKLQRDFQQALVAFQAIQKSGVRKEKEALAYVKAQSDEPEAEQVGALQAQEQVPRVSHAELEYQEALIAEREAEIREIEAGVQELNEIFRDLSHIVQEQGGMIDNIEYNITNISTNAQGADRELLQAHDYQRRAGRRSACLMIIVAFVVFVVLLAVRGVH